MIRRKPAILEMVHMQQAAVASTTSASGGLDMVSGPVDSGPDSWVRQLHCLHVECYSRSGCVPPSQPLLSATEISPEPSVSVQCHEAGDRRSVGGENALMRVDVCKVV